MLVHEEEDEGERVAQLADRRGLVLLTLGISISLDELAMGFTIGLLHLNIWLVVVLIGAQAFLFAQLGLRLGSRINETLRERAERLAGVALLALALLLALEKLTAQCSPGDAPDCHRPLTTRQPAWCSRLHSVERAVFFT